MKIESHKVYTRNKNPKTYTPVEVKVLEIQIEPSSYDYVVFEHTIDTLDTTDNTIKYAKGTKRHLPTHMFINNYTKVEE
jgi:hypothetical protein